VDQTVLQEFLGRAVGDLGATLSAALVVIGDRLGLYRAMADGTPVTAISPIMTPYQPVVVFLAAMTPARSR
jgi:hypothetical protein